VRFANRTDAGEVLAERVRDLMLTDPVVLALPRGGVPVAYQVAQVLGAPLEVVVARKVGAPGQPELGIGAIAEGNTSPVASSLAAQLGVDDRRFALLAEAEQAELDRRVARYRGDRPLPEMEGRDVVLVDDGLATGVTAEAALRSLRRHRPRTLVLAVPVAAPDSVRRLAGAADRIVYVHAPHDFRAVGAWYQDFDQTTDGEVLDLLAAARRRWEAQ
jgi:putative phosphoribosyl transferase